MIRMNEIPASAVTANTTLHMFLPLSTPQRGL